MKLRHPTLLRCFGFAGACLLKGWLGTLRTRMDCAASGGIPVDRRRQRVIYSFWHEHTLIAAKFGRHSRVLISKHTDGELITQIIARMGMTAVRGSSRRGGAGAVLDLIHGQRQNWHVAITPDGPRGPRRRIQPGVTYIASKIGLPIVPIGVGYEQAWRANSWDRFAVPYPWSLVTIATAPLMYVPAGTGGAGLEAYRRLLEEQMHFLAEDAQRWAEGRPRLPKSDLPTAAFLPPIAAGLSA